MIGALVIGIVLFIIFSLPATWLLMLFIGNLGVGLSFGGALPLGMLVSALIGAAGSQRTV
jgi:hypothetical protein